MLTVAALFVCVCFGSPGSFATAEDAALTYDAAVREIRGVKGITNLPEPPEPERSM